MTQPLIQSNESNFHGQAFMCERFPTTINQIGASQIHSNHNDGAAETYIQISILYVSFGTIVSPADFCLV